MITSLRNAVFTKTKGIFSERLYFAQAPEETQYPYGVFSELPGFVDRDSVSRYEFVIIQINGYSKQLEPLETIEAQLKALLDRSQASFNLTDYYVIDVDWIFSRTAILDTRPEGTFQFTHQYRFHLQLKD